MMGKANGCGGSFCEDFVVEKMNFRTRVETKMMITSRRVMALSSLANFVCKCSIHINLLYNFKH